MDKEKIVFIIIGFAAVCVALYFLTKKSESFATPVGMIKPPLRRDMNDFRIHNHYRVPIDVIVIPQDRESNPNDLYNSGIKVGESIPTTLAGQMGNVIDSGYDYFARGSIVLAYASKNRELLGKAVMNIPEGKAPRALHLGMNSGQDDLSMKGDPIRSPLGSAIPRLRIVNASPRVLRLSTVAMLNDGKLEPDLVIKPFDSILYLGQYWKGIPLGVVFKDVDGYLDDYKLQYPITDLFMGIMSDIHEPQYNGAKFGGSFDDTVSTVSYPLEEGGIGKHKGSKINTKYIPSTW